MFHIFDVVKAKKAVNAGLLVAASIAMGGCTTISDWFVDDEELEVRRLKPLEQRFDVDVVWEASVGRGVEGFFSRLRPVYAGGKLFVADRHGKVAALNPENGDVVWERDFATYEDEGYFSLVSRIWASGESAKIAGLNVKQGLVFIGTENGEIIAMSVDSGETKWRATVPGEILAAPAIEESIVVVNTGSGSLFALDANSGERLWQSEGDTPPLTLRGISAPLASNGGAMIGTATGKLQVNILNNGAVAWEAAIAKPSGATALERIVDIDTAPIAYGGTIYVISYHGTLAAVELRTGRIVWQREYGSYRNVSMQDNMLFVVDVNSNVYGLDRRNGVELWSQGGLRNRSLTAVEPVGDYLVTGDKWGIVHWLDINTGELVSRIDIGGDDEDESVYVAPLKVEDKVVVVTRVGDVTALKARY